LPAVAGASRSGEQTEERTKAAFQGVSPRKFSDISIRHRGRLPHWNKDSGLYFVTFRTADSLPQKRLCELHDELRVAGKPDRLRQKRLEDLLDGGAGLCAMKDPRCADVVSSALTNLDGKQYRLLAWCVMPNHVHFVARLLPSVTLSAVMHSLKSFSAKRINAVLGRSGPVWQREYYDRLIRDADELSRAINYIARNPEKAGLSNWKWLENRAQDAPETAGGTPALQRKL
jgi:putative transposase